MKKLIASGEVIGSAEGVELYASVWVELDAKGEEKEMAEAGDHYVALEYKELGLEAASMPKDGLKWADMAKAGLEGTLEVPGLDGRENVQIKTPTAVHYAKSKAFVSKDGKKANIYGKMRYNF